MSNRQRVGPAVLLFLCLAAPFILFAVFAGAVGVRGAGESRAYLPMLVLPGGDKLELVGQLAGVAHHVTVAGQYAYVGDGDGGLHIVDVSDPERPSAVGFVATPGYVKDVAVADGYAFVADSGQGLRIIDVRKPADAKEVGSFFMPGYFNGVAVAGDYAYVVGEYIGLRVIRVNNPAKPQEVGFLETRHAYDVALSGGYAYSVEEGGLRVINVSDPAEPDETALANAVRAGASIAVQGSRAFVAGRSGGLSIVDVSSPDAPSEMGSFDAPGGPLSDSYGVAVSGKSVYLTDWDHGLHVIDVANPARPRETARYATPGMVFDVAAADGLVYVAADQDGLLALRHTKSD